MAEAVATEVEETDAPDASPAEQHHASIRDSIEAAFDKHTEETPAEEAEPPAPAREGRARDEKGRFQPKEEAAPLEPPKGRKRQTAPAELEAPEAALPKLAKPDPVEALPASFKPDVLEHWKGVPRQVKEEIHRREAESYALLERTKGERQALQEIQQAIGPYQALLQAEGGSPATSLRNYLQAATLMRQGAPQAKAQWIAKLVRTFTAQEHLPLLDQALMSEFGINGAAPPNGQAQPQFQPQEFRDPRVDQMLHQQQQAREQWLQQGLEEARSEKDTWVSEKQPEFLPWVQSRMASLMETAAKDGEDLGYEEAYDAACRTHPQVRAILQQREEAARAQPSAVQKSRRANVSLKPQGAIAPAPGAEGNSIRGDISEAWEAVMGR